MNESIRIAAISPLRQRLIDDMNMRRFSRETQRNYIRDVGRFATFLRRSPDTATADDVRRFQIEQRDAGVPTPTMNSIVSALRFFFTHTIDRPDLARKVIRIAHPRNLPVVLSREALVRQLARLMPDRQIARLLNRSGKSTGYGNGWTEQRVRGFRNHHDIAVYRDGEWADRGEITLDAAAQTIGVAKMTALRMIRRGDLKGRQACKGAPWVIKAEDVAAFGPRSPSTGPVTPNPAQQILEFQ